MQRLSLIKASHLNQNRVLPQLHSAFSITPSVQIASRVHHVIEYGADPTGTSDSTEALEQAIHDAFQSPLEDSHLMEGVSDLGGVEVHLDGGTYKISRPLRLPDSGGGNLMIHSGSLCASGDFPSDRHLIELRPRSTSSPFEDITLKDIMINSNFRGGGISVVDSLRTTIDNCYISHFTTSGILIQGGHETYVRNSFIGQHINVGGDRREKDFSGIGINIVGNDNSITDVVIFSASVGIMVAGQANVFTGVHCYNKATTLGGTGIYIRAPGFTQTRILNCYFDFTGIVVEDPVQFHVTNSFFLGNAFILIKSLNGVVSGVNIVDNMFSGDYTGVRIVQLDESKREFHDIDQVVVERNNVRGMTLKSTVARGTAWSNGTIWTVDFSKVLLFPNLIKYVQYTLHAGALFPNHVLRNVSRNRVTVESDAAVSATLHVSVDQTMISYV
ncbi:Pectate lyase superfamily protein [Parasponia andersonii]|uniref:Pectate lyase superfamily protein n=1 Tax=Parasponia andersonii TaxID=3476 RepID=A0A2P5CIU2_PARAD|nr:Pectate lyase superfamily protein [Parasponia andersonii]